MLNGQVIETRRGGMDMSFKLAPDALVAARRTLMKELQARNKRAEASFDKPSCPRRMTISARIAAR
jgi:hypothetical protein